MCKIVMVEKFMCRFIKKRKSLWLNLGSKKSLWLESKINSERERESLKLVKRGFISAVKYSNIYPQLISFLQPTHSNNKLW